MIDGDTTVLEQVGAPVVVLILLAWLLPTCLHWLIGEGVVKLFVITAIAATVLWIGTGAYIWSSDFGWRGLGGVLATADLGAVSWYVFVQGARASIIWAPVLVLSVSSLPRRWKEAVW